MGKLSIMQRGSLLEYDNADQAPFVFGKGWAFTLDGGKQEVWFGSDDVEWFRFDGRKDDSEESTIASLKLDIDDEWMKELVNTLIEEINRQSKNGKIIMVGRS